MLLRPIVRIPQNKVETDKTALIQGQDFFFEIEN